MKTMDKIMQGDSYGIPIAIQTANGWATPDKFSEIEIIIGDMRKTLSSGQLTYDYVNAQFIFPLTQEETFGLSTNPQRVQVRCKFLNGEVVGQNLGNINVTPSLSRAVL